MSRSARSARRLQWEEFYTRLHILVALHGGTITDVFRHAGRNYVPMSRRASPRSAAGAPDAYVEHFAEPFGLTVQDFFAPLDTFTQAAEHARDSKR